MHLTIHGLDEKPLCLYNVVAVPEVGETLVHQTPEGTRGTYHVVRRTWVVARPPSMAGLPMYETMLDVALWMEAILP